jgi:phenylacetate-coenzyme A ligase PaaK-like adenylate-forming protein
MTTTLAATTEPVVPDAIRARAGELLALDRWPRADVLAFQRERLRELLRHAVEHSPYYREALGSDAPDRPLESLPTLPKPLLMEQFDRVVTDPQLRRSDLEAFLDRADAGAAYLGRYHIFSTAGTTGVPGIFVYSQVEFAEWISVCLAALARVGVTPQTRLVAIGAPSALHITRRLFAVFQAGREGAPRLAVTNPLAEIVAALDAYQPEVIVSYPSIMAALADEQLEGRLAISPRVAIMGSEVLTDDAARRIEAAWGIPALNVYASTEAPPIATSAPENVGMHVWESNLVLEVVDVDNRPIPPGERGVKVLVTNLANRTQPLIRYELYDSVMLASGPDPTGRPWLRIASVDGRSDDILRLPRLDGGEVRVHPFRLRRPFVRLVDVLQYQVVHRADGLLVRIVMRDSAARDLPETVRAAVEGALREAGAVAPVTVEPVERIEREPGHAAKVKLVCTEVAPPR